MTFCPLSSPQECPRGMTTTCEPKSVQQADLGWMISTGCWMNFDLGGLRNRSCWWHLSTVTATTMFKGWQSHVSLCVSPIWHQSDCDASPTRPTHLSYSQIQQHCSSNKNNINNSKNKNNHCYFLCVCGLAQVETFQSVLNLCLNCSVH